MSHHSSSEEEANALHAAMKNLLGEFPDGKLNQDDEGALAMIVTEESGKVVIRFPKLVAYVGFTPDQALGVAQSLIEKARDCGSTIPLVITIGKSK